MEMLVSEACRRRAFPHPNGGVAGGARKRQNATEKLFNLLPYLFSRAIQVETEKFFAQIAKKVDFLSHFCKFRKKGNSDRARENGVRKGNKRGNRL